MGSAGARPATRSEVSVFIKRCPPKRARSFKKQQKSFMFNLAQNIPREIPREIPKEIPREIPRDRPREIPRGKPLGANCLQHTDEDHTFVAT